MKERQTRRVGQHEPSVEDAESLKPPRKRQGDNVNGAGTLLAVRNRMRGHYCTYNRTCALDTVPYGIEEGPLKG